MTSNDIRATRLALRLTQIEFAARIGVDPITVSRWERGKARPQNRLVIAALKRLAKRAGR